MSQRFSLDRQTFERFLAAASLVQQVRSQALPFTLNPTDTLGLSGLVETQQAIQTGALDLEAACFQLTSLALRLTGAHGAGVWLFTQDAFVYRAGAGTASNSERLRLAVLAGLAGTQPKADTPDLSGSIRCSKAKSLLVAPIYQGPRVSGALAVFSEAEKAFADRDIASTRLLAGILAHAVDKAAEAELKQSVALERAAMQKVVERLIPSLMRLTGQDGAVFSADSAANDELRPSASSASPQNGADLVAPQADEIMSSVGSLRRPERTFAQEAELAETNPRWVQSLNPGFQRWVPIGATDPLYGTRARATGSELASPPVPTPSLPEQAPAGALPPGPAPQSTPVAVPVPECLPAYAPTISDVPERIQSGSFFQAVKAGRESLRSIHHFRLNVRFAFNYRPTLRAMSLGVTAALLSITAFLALQSGESAMLATVAAGRSRADASATEPSPLRSVPVPVNKASDAVTRAAQTSPAARRMLRSRPPAVESSHLRITDPRASNMLGSLSRYEIASLQRRAEYGDDGAAFLLGMAYELGRGVPRSCSQAAKWVRLAASRGNAAAEYNLGLRYRSADGVTLNTDEAENWFRRAARHRYGQAAASGTAERPDGSRSEGQP